MTPRGETLYRVAKASAPTVLGLFGVLALALPIRLAEGVAPTPLFPLIIVYFWSIYGPDYMPGPSVFAIGLLQDLLTGGPLGLWALVYLTTQYAVLAQRSYFLGREQRVVWIGFGVAAFVAALMLWGVMSLMRGEVMLITAVAGQLVATIAVYPLFSMAFAQLHRRVIVEA